MSQVSSPVIAVGLVLTAVFIPCAFITGITGQFYRQFALTIATSTSHLGVQLADLEPGPVGTLAQAEAEGSLPGAAVICLRGLGLLARVMLPWPLRWSHSSRSGSPRHCRQLRESLRRAGLGTGDRRPDRLGPELPLEPDHGLVLLRFQQGLRCGDRTPIPAWSAGCCESACWCWSCTAGCWV